MGGGESSVIDVTKISGFGLPAPRYDEIEFAKENGVTTTGASDYPRSMFISGDLYGGRSDKLKMLEAFYYPGELYCDFGPDMKRKIACKLINFDDIEDLCNSGINTFAIQLQADYPYFNDFDDTVINLSGYRNHVTESFELPCVFTEQIQEGKVYNYGNKNCYGVITITSKYDATVAEGLVTVSNHTTGNSIHISHSLQKDEVIEIDLNTRRIMSSVSGRITNAITDDTEMSNFYLVPGLNELSFGTNDTLRPVSATMRYNNIYLAAVR